MELQDLPTELLFNILFYAVVYESGLLDSVRTHSCLICWDLDNYHGPSNFWHAYLAYKVRMAEKCSSSDRHDFNLHQIAEYVCKETNADMDETIEKLCWPALMEGSDRIWRSTISPNEPLYLGLHLLGAAAYLGLIPLAQRLLREGHSLIGRCYYFSHASPIELAVEGENASILQLFQEYLPEIDYPGIDADNDTWMAWLAGKTGTDAVEQAARSGDINILRLAIYPPSRAKPESTEFMGQQYGSIDVESDIGVRLRRGQGNTSNLEIYKYLEGFFAEPDKISHTLSEHAHRGNIEILLDYGANICLLYEERTVGFHALREAVRLEHTGLVKLLLQSGVDVTENDGEILELALQDGLDSMTELLQQAVAAFPGSKDVV
ncbi:glycolipid 2-alpha-mannosyltransferase protein [Rutstroemia sp. NJR-2017a WRK4]|nr:glycolipid 2-alpha-mannosyltransferase protein [Rutstroemia sp. NJR-2017a WRK4]